MSTQPVLEWIVCVTSCLLPGQLALVAAVRTKRLNLATIGRRMAGTVSAKHTIKRAWRFTCNRRAEVDTAMAGVIKRLARKRKKPLIASVVWIDVRHFYSLMAPPASAAGPLLWASYTGKSPRRSWDCMEELLLRRLRALIPGSVPVKILADRGFGQAELAAVCQELKFRYMVRIKPDVTISRSTKKGMTHLFKGVDCRKDKRVVHNIAIR